MTTAGHWWMLGHTFNGNHRLRFRLKTGGVTTTLVASSGNLTANTWLHAAATYDGSTMRLYLNGVEVGNGAKTGVIDVSPAVAVNLGRNPEGSNYLPGRLDEVRIYERSLSQTEIQQVMNGSSGLNVPIAAATSYDKWRQTHFTAADLADAVISGDTCDPDGDRISNLMEYALGLDPQATDLQARPAARLENSVLVLTHTRNKEATDVALGVEAAPALAGPWSSAGLTQQVVSDDGVVQTIQVMDSVPVGTAESRFLRLTVQQLR